MRFYLNYKHKKVEIDVKVCNFFWKIIGLMFTRRRKAKALLFDFKQLTRGGIHSYFVFFPFIAVWLDDKNKVVDVKLVKPFSPIIKSKKPFFRLVEIPVNKEYKDVVKFLSSTRDLARN